MFSSIATVIGPTPPGTGVIADATSETPSKSTSPASRYPRFRDESSTRFTPTSITTAPGRTISAVIAPALPAAATKISARRVCDPRSSVAVWQIVTVAFAPDRFCASIAPSGIPTSLDLPTITTCFPPGSFPERTSNCCTPCGVAGKNRSRPSSTRP